LNSTSGWGQFYRWHRTSGVIELVTPNASADGGATYHSINPSISGDGNRISFHSFSDNLIAGINDVNGVFWSGQDVYVRDMSTDTTMLVSRSSSNPNQTANRLSYENQISRDGSKVVFRSLGSDLVAGVTDNNSSWDLYAFRIDSETMVAVSLAINGTSTGDYGVDATFSLSNNG
jgi:hypothetical protein